MFDEPRSGLEGFAPPRVKSICPGQDEPGVITPIHVVVLHFMRRTVVGAENHFSGCVEHVVQEGRRSDYIGIQEYDWIPGPSSPRIPDHHHLWRANASCRRSQLQILREAAGLSRVEFARRADLAHSTVYLLEDGLVSDFYVSTLMKIATALDVTPNELLGIK